MKLSDWLEAHWEPGNLLAPEMDAADAGSILVDELLPGFYVPYPCNAKQALTEIVAAVVATYKPKPSLWRRMMDRLFARATAENGGVAKCADGLHGVPDCRGCHADCIAVRHAANGGDK